MTKRIPLIAHNLKRLYTGFLIAAVLLFFVCSYLTNFNIMTLFANGDAFWEFITEDFLPPCAAKIQQDPRHIIQCFGNAGAGGIRHDSCSGPGLLCVAVWE